MRDEDGKVIFDEEGNMKDETVILQESFAIDPQGRRVN
jgi:hypothetical protein